MSFLLKNPVRKISLCFLLFMGFLLCSPANVMAQSLDDFKEAAGHTKGVELIPFKKIRIEATAIADEKNRAFRVASRYNFKNYGPKKDKLLAEKAKNLEDIEEYIEDGEALKKKSDSAVDSPFQDDIDDLEDDNKEIDKKIEAINNDMADAAEAWREVWNARGGLRETFDDALDELGKAKSYPKKYIGKDASDSDLKELKKYIDKIKSNIQKQIRTHRDQETGAQGTETKFNDAIKKTSL